MPDMVISSLALGLFGVGFLLLYFAREKPKQLSSVWIVEYMDDEESRIVAACSSAEMADCIVRGDSKHLLMSQWELNHFNS